ncbi:MULTISPECIES: heme ABC exporter ATP-binding protein CcmA [unclassified Sphingomonas]|uniref:heme ABC exporter ATP-binding protein CcmA n=1 Tax=unclassified Sphingomonas TaxID=196159 RepID=UPI00226A4B4D|nr:MULTISPECIES: heme ABC exporter ATP-binding protein CcmA [unclassified Sphingomonas]
MAGQATFTDRHGALALTGVACTRGGRMLFEGLDLALGAGQAVLVTGPNGAGKSSLLRIVAGLLAPSHGQARCEGGVALLDERHALDPERRLCDALGFWARLDAGEAALAALALDRLAAVPVRLLSTGQRRRATLARIVAGDAWLWLLDEPANGLDAPGLALVEALIAGHRAAGGAVMVATHLPMALPGATAVRLG